MRKYILMTAVAAGASALFAFSPTESHAQECGGVTIADMDWSSATLMANIDAFILRNGYGCDVELVPGATEPTGTSMTEKGQPDIAPELWTNSMVAAIDLGVAENRLVVAGSSLTDGGEEGFWVPKYLVDQNPALATIDGIKANAALFENPEDPNSSLFMGCPSGWNCQISAGNLFKAFGLGDAGFVLGDPGSGAGLAGSLAKAYERNEPWFGYYWAPTPLLGRFEMVKVDFGVPLDLEHYQACIAQEECDDPQPTAYPSSPIQTVATTDFAGRAPAAFGYLASRSFTNAFMNTLLAWMDENQADGEVAAIYFLNEHEDTWAAWVGDEVADNIRGALASL